MAIFEKLREWRSQISRRQKKPAYTVLGNRSLEDLAALDPESKGDLQRAFGVGPAKVEKYGDELLEILRSS